MLRLLPLLFIFLLLLAGVSTLFSATSSASVTPYKADYPAPIVPNDSLAMIASGEKLFNKTLPCGACHG